MWSRAVRCVAVAGVPALKILLDKERYEDLKGAFVFDERRRVKHKMRVGGLEGWVSDGGDGGWGLEDEGGL